MINTEDKDGNIVSVDGDTAYVVLCNEIERISHKISRFPDTLTSDLKSNLDRIEDFIDVMNKYIQAKKHDS